MLFSLSHTLAFALLSVETIAAPAQFEKKTFSVKQVRNEGARKSGPAAMMRVVMKYGTNVPKKFFRMAAGDQNGTVEADPLVYDSSYLSPVTIGNNQTLHLDFDTGSSDLWVFSTQLTTPLAQGQEAWTPDASAKELPGYTWKIGYADGSGASGNVYMDKVVIGGVTATSQAVEAATSVSQSFSQTAHEDGMLGLGFSNINTVQPQQQTTFFETVKSTLKEALFTVTLKKGTAGSYDFGYIDDSKYTGDITYVPVNGSRGYWDFTAGNNIGYSIMDTGTSLLILPQANVDAYWGSVSGAKYDSQQQGYTFPCAAQLPDFPVDIGGTTFSVPGSYLNYAPIDNVNQNCFGGLQSSSNVDFNIFGDVFMKAFFVVFDDSQSSPRLGIANQANRTFGNTTTTTR